MYEAFSKMGTLFKGGHYLRKYGKLGHAPLILKKEHVTYKCDLARVGSLTFSKSLIRFPLG